MIIQHNAKEFGSYVKNIIVKYLQFVPKEHLRGIERISLFGNSSRDKPKGQYWPLSKDASVAEIHIYVDQCLGYPLSANKEKRTSRLGIGSYLYIFLFGRLFLADVLFHEIGHHKFTMDMRGGAQKDSEEYAEKYATELLWKAHPFIFRHYYFINALFRTVYRKRIARANQIEEIAE